MNEAFAWAEFAAKPKQRVNMRLASSHKTFHIFDASFIFFTMVSHHVHSADVYRLFLQAALSRRVMTDAIAKALWKACYDAVARKVAATRAMY